MKQILENVEANMVDKDYYMALKEICDRNSDDCGTVVAKYSIDMRFAPHPISFIFSDEKMQPALESGEDIGDAEVITVYSQDEAREFFHKRMQQQVDEFLKENPPGDDMFINLVIDHIRQENRFPDKLVLSRIQNKVKEAGQQGATSARAKLAGSGEEPNPATLTEMLGSINEMLGNIRLVPLIAMDNIGKVRDARHIGAFKVYIKLCKTGEPRDVYPEQRVAIEATTAPFKFTLEPDIRATNYPFYSSGHWTITPLPPFDMVWKEITFPERIPNSGANRGRVMSDGKDVHITTLPNYREQLAAIHKTLAEEIMREKAKGPYESDIPEIELAAGDNYFSKFEVNMNERDYERFVAADTKKDNNMIKFVKRPR
ncbi:MAG: hypothetical protein LBM38_02540 [Clostridiales bacterium]|jgi:hypothetical protein|nr:hypothetical protein [Clostridiales bacterium]